MNTRPNKSVEGAEAFYKGAFEIKIDRGFARCHGRLGRRCTLISRLFIDGKKGRFIRHGVNKVNRALESLYRFLREILIRRHPRQVLCRRVARRIGEAAGEGAINFRFLEKLRPRRVPTELRVSNRLHVGESSERRLGGIAEIPACGQVRKDILHVANLIIDGEGGVKLRIERGKSPCRFAEVAKKWIGLLHADAVECARE